MKKLLSIILTIAMLFTLCISVFATEGEQYKITSPYDGIDWSSVNQYKTALHSHTNTSDGDQTLLQSIERHVETGFDIVSVTDHGVVDFGWTTTQEKAFSHVALKLFGRTEGDLVSLSDEGTFSDGTGYSYTTENGDDYLTLSDGRKILRVPYGTENNAVSVNAHVNSWFANYNNNTVSTYEEAVKGVDKAGGISVINYPGEYTKARYELHSSDAYNTENASYNYYINKYATLLNKYDSLIGIDINSKSDNRTRYDRILWDELLERFSANGKNVFAIASSDAHQLNIIDTGFVYTLMNDQTSSSLRSSLSQGQFIPASHCIGNYDELSQIATSLKEFYGTTDLYKKVSAVVSEMEQKVSDIESGKLDADEDIGIVYSVLDSNGYCIAKTQPKITKIETGNDTIKITSENALIVRFISDGNLLTTVKADDGSINLDEYADQLGDYVRAEIFGEGGIVYTQAFLLNDDERTDSKSVTNGCYVNLGLFDFLLAVFNNWKEIIIRGIRH